jgi:hypothetical protein
MKVFIDYAGRSIRLTDERRDHLLTHPEMMLIEPMLTDAIASPDTVVRSRTDALVRLYYRATITGEFGEKWLCVVIKISSDDAFVITAYLTDRIKPGETIWTRP